MPSIEHLFWQSLTDLVIFNAMFSWSLLGLSGECIWEPVERTMNLKKKETKKHKQVKSKYTDKHEAWRL